MNFFPFNFRALTALPFWDRKDTDFFVISKFFLNFFEKIFRLKISEELPHRLSHLRAAKVDIISSIPNFFAPNFKLF